MTQIEALGLTVAFELPVALAWFGRARWLARAAWLRGAMVVVAASLLTHPLAWQANQRWLRGWSFGPRAAVIEVGVAALEAGVLAWGLGLRPGRALVVAATMNATSFALGLLVIYARRA